MEKEITQYEYDTAVWGGLGSTQNAKDKQIEALNAIGRKGWLLVGVEPNGTMIFARPIKAKSDLRDPRIDPQPGDELFLDSYRFIIIATEYFAETQRSIVSWYYKRNEPYDYGIVKNVTLDQFRKIFSNATLS